MNSIEEGLSWIGLRVDDRLISELVEESTFFWLYRGHGIYTGLPELFKVAKPMGAARGKGDIFRTQWLIRTPSGQTDLPAADLLVEEANFALTHPDSDLLAVRAIVTDAGLPYIRMDNAPANLRALMKKGPVAPGVMLSVLECLSGLELQFGENWHGDLTPEQIWLDGSRVKVSGLGHWGPILDGVDAIVTTPAYYPNLRKDDTLAAGLMCWEAICGVHPLKPVPDCKRIPFTAEVLESLQSAGGQTGDSLDHFVVAIRHGIDVSPDLERVLLKGLRMAFDEEGLLEFAPGFEDITDMLAEFQAAIE